MASASPALSADANGVQRARRHGMLRFSVAVTATFIICEAMGWQPTFLAPLLTAVLLASLPKALPVKAGLVVMLVMTASAIVAYVLPSLLQKRPEVLFGLIGLIIFLSFATLASGRGQLPVTLLLICIATIPIVTLVAPAQAGVLPMAYARGMVLAVAAVWAAHAFWPKTLPASAPPPATAGLPPVRLAIAGSAIVLPLMLVYLMFGITDALPILITTIFLVVNFDPKRGRAQAAAMMMGNLIGGMIALVAFHLLQIAPSLIVLALLTFFIALQFALQLEKGGPVAAVALVTFNQAIIIFGLGIASGSSNSGLWITRLAQFGIACLFALAMMVLIFPRSGQDSEVK